MELSQFAATLHAWWTVWMVLVFIGIVIYAVWPGNRAKFKHASSIPFLDESKEV